MAPAAVHWGPRALVRHTAPPQWVASPVDHHDNVFLGERHRIAPIGPFIELNALG
jgi:hypothetical protein